MCVSNQNSVQGICSNFCVRNNEARSLKPSIEVWKYEPEPSISKSKRRNYGGSMSKSKPKGKRPSGPCSAAGTAWKLLKEQFRAAYKRY